ncbi:hypothetical protein GCM10009125_28400 [Castellaniella daejeonensis]|uniref:Uncharacterized protein n=1 Tax=Castellaniella daejeonensis TaxID=659013 RepID=A0ABN0U4L0_9BURK
MDSGCLCYALLIEGHMPGPVQNRFRAGSLFPGRLAGRPGSPGAEPPCRAFRAEARPAGISRASLP